MAGRLSAPLLIVVALFILPGAVGQAPSPSRPTGTEWREKQAELEKEAKEAAAKESKMAAVSKVVELLDNLKDKILFEGEQEALAYNEFACFCKDTSAGKTDAIQKGTDESNTLLAKVNGYSSTRQQLDSNIALLQGNIKSAEDAMTAARAQRAKELKQYTIEEADLSGAVHALVEAIAALKASKPVSLAQLKGIQSTVYMADALGISRPGDHKLILLSEPPEVPTQNYKFHSDDIIATLESLLDRFRAEKTELDDAEVKAVNQHNLFIQEQTDLVSGYTTSLKSDMQNKAKTQALMQEASQDLSGVKTTLADDREYLAELTDMCSNRAKTWDQRSTMRQNELQALTQALGVVKAAVTNKTTGATVRLVQKHVALDSAALAAIEAEAELVDREGTSATRKVTLFQLSSLRSRRLRSTKSFPGQDQGDGKQAVVNLLRLSGQKFKSELLTSLASQVANDPFEKVKALIQELLERLLKQQENEANQKGWCTQAISTAERKRDYASQEVIALDANMARLEAEIAKLGSRLDKLGAEITELKTKRSDAEQMRSTEQQENHADIADAKVGLEAVKEAIDILGRFYKTAAVAEVSLQVERGPAEDAPDVFAGGEAYKGAQGDAFGILGMLDVIKGDFERTISVTAEEERQAQADHLEFMTETGKSLAAKTTAEGEASRLKGEAEQQYSDDNDDLESQVSLLQSAVNELFQLKPACVNTDMTYQERKERREEEIQALKQALCILGSYQQYGPTGVPTDC